VPIDRPSRATLVTPPPAPVNSRLVVTIGTILWFVAFVVLLPFYGWLGEHGHRVWLWTCLAGWVLGLLGLALMSRHRKAGRTL
jgi:hypothetical protein